MTETRKAVFLDRDGTINVDKDYLYKIEEFEYLPGVKDALKRFQAAGYELIIITNQSGIGRGYYTEEDFKKLCDFMTEDLKKDGIEISDIYYCPHLPEAAAIEYRADCDCRKPKKGMFLRAVSEHDLDITQCIAVGDKIRDLSICEDCREGYLLYQDENRTEGNIHYIKGGLSEMAELVING